MTYISTNLKRLVKERANNCCEYCLLSQSDNPFPFHIEHIISEKHGGDTTPDNLCLSCPDCNLYKGSDIASNDPKTGKITRFYNPRIQKWNEHFQFDDTLTIIEPLTDIGRVTIKILRLNNDEQIEARKILTQLGTYPCTR